MEINVHFPAIYPCGDLIRNGRQGMEEGLFIQVGFITAALPFLETAAVKGIKFPEYCGLQFLKGIKQLVPETGDDCCCDLTDSPPPQMLSVFGLRIPAGMMAVW